MKLIDKDALVAEIEKLINEIYNGQPFDSLSREKQVALWYVKSIMSSVNSLEVKEADLEKEINKYISDNFFGSETIGFYSNRTKEEPNYQDIALCAKHFFELGLKAQKGE